MHAGKQLAQIDFSQDALGMSKQTAGRQDAGPERVSKPIRSFSLSEPQGAAPSGSGSSSGNSSQSGTSCGSARCPQQNIVSGVLVTSPQTDQPLVGRSGSAPESPRCLPLDPDLPFCTGTGQKSFSVPNFLNQSSVGEVRAALGAWAWLLRSGCHPSLEWFYCLLLAPPCPAPGRPPAPAPSRAACQALEDGCWGVLRGGGGGLIVPCPALPNPERPEYGPDRRARPCPCARQGNGGLECIPAGMHFQPPVCLPSANYARSPLTLNPTPIRRAAPSPPLRSEGCGLRASGWGVATETSLLHALRNAA